MLPIPEHLRHPPTLEVSWAEIEKLRSFLLCHVRTCDAESRPATLEMAWELIDTMRSALVRLEMMGDVDDYGPRYAAVRKKLRAL